MSTFPTRLLDAEAPAPAQVDLLPFHINHNGPAAISTYFLRRPCPEDLAQGPGELVSAFRGRELHGTPIALPKGYTGRVMQVSAPSFVREKPRGGKAKVTAIPRKRASTAVAPVDNAKKRRTSPRKAKMTFSLDTPPSSPVKGDADELAVDEAMEEDVPPPVEEVKPTRTSPRKKTPSPQKKNVIAEPQVKEEEQPEEVAVEEPIQAAMADARTTIDLKAVNTFTSLMLWSPDAIPVDQGADPYVRALQEWTALSELIHAPC